MKVKTTKSFKSVMAAGMIAGGIFTQSVSAQMLYSDSFSSADGTLGFGRTPDVTEASAFSGNTYGDVGNSFFQGTSTIQSGVQHLRADYGLGLAFGSDPDFASLGTSQFHLSLDFTLFGLENADNDAERGIGLGFYSAMVGTAAAHGWQGFYGIQVDSSGNVKLFDNVGNTTTYYASANVGALSTSASHTLSYNVNTSSGAVSGIILDGSAVTLNFGANANNVFTGSDINFVGFDANESNFQHDGLVDNFSVSAVPEPEAFALVLTGAATLVAFKRKK